MAMTEAELEPQPPVGGVTIVYTGPTAPHWEFRFHYGDRTMNEDFRARAMARLLLLPPHDPQFRRNRERVIRDAERVNIELTWDLGLPEENSATPEPTVEEAAAAETEAAEADATDADAETSDDAATDDATTGDAEAAEDAAPAEEVASDIVAETDAETAEDAPEA